MTPELQTGARRAIEALRAGVPNRDAVTALACEQPHIETAFKERLDALKQQPPVSQRGLLIEGGFGTGKSHVLAYLMDIGLRSGFVCSRVVISKETPIHDTAKVFRAAAESAIVPGRELCDAFTEIATGLKLNSPSYSRLYQLINEPRSGIDPLFAATLLLLEEGGGDREMFNKITRFWAGGRLSVAEVRKSLKACGHASSFQIRSVPAQELAAQRFEFSSALIAASGFSGWILFFDEIELIGRYSLLQRAKSYASLCRWIERPCLTEVGRIGTIAAITDDFEAKVLDVEWGKADRANVPARLHNAARQADRAIANDAVRGMEIISKERVPLRKPDESTLTRTYEKVKSIYSQAYGINAGEQSIGAMTADVRLRQYIKSWITHWDLKRIDPTYDVKIQVKDVQSDYTENSNLEMPAEGDLEEEAP